MKITRLAFVLVLSVSLYNAQVWMGEGDQKIQSGINLWGRGSFGFRASYDYGISKVVSIGGGIGVYSQGKMSGDNKTTLSVYARANYHLNEELELSDRFGVYPGISLGIFGKSLDFGAHIGLRYFLTPHIGVFTELGNRGLAGITINF